MTVCIYCGGPDGMGCGSAPRDYREPEDTTGVCLAMNLTRNHCIYFGRMLTEPDYQRDQCPCYAHRKWRGDCARAELSKRMARAREVWPAEHTQWLSAFEALLVERAAPQHHAVHVGEQLDLLAVS